MFRSLCLMRALIASILLGFPAFLMAQLAQNIGSLAVASDPMDSVDVMNKESVTAFYNKYFVASDNVKWDAAANGWTGSLTPPIAGTTNVAFQKAILSRINAYRVLAGQTALTGTYTGLNQAAQEGALILSLNWTTIPITDHHSPKQSDCPKYWTTLGLNGCADGNIVHHVDNKTISALVDVFIDDSSVISCGHRRSHLSNAQIAFGEGWSDGDPKTGGGVELHVFEQGAPTPSTNPHSMWPYTGYMPYGLYARSAGVYWSFADIFDLYDGTNANVAVTINNVPVTVSANKMPYDGVTINAYTAADAQGSPNDVIKALMAKGLDAHVKVTITNVFDFDNMVTVAPVTNEFTVYNENPVAVTTSIVTNPVGTSMVAGNALNLSVSALGNSLSYQWYKDGTAIDGATSATYSLAQASSLDIGSYTVKVSGTNGTVTSPAVNVAITPTLVSNPNARLVNISSRTPVSGKDENVQIAGFVIDGDKPKRVLIRAGGPALKAWISNTLEDPVVTLYNSKSLPIATNDDWDYDTVNPIAQPLGAYDWAKASKDAAILITLEPGLYSAIINDKNGGSGVSLVEVYEVDQSDTAKQVNISTRSLVGTGDNVQVAGFVISGTGPKTVLIRSGGPALKAWIKGTLADPTLTVYNSKSLPIASNDNWDYNSVQSIAKSLGAYDFEKDSKDSAIVLTLPPGLYSAIIKDVTGGTGVALVEVYEVNK